MGRIHLILGFFAIFMALNAPFAEAKGKKGCPPGLAKQGKCHKAGKGTRHAPGLRHKRWDRWQDAGLDRAPRGQVYVVIDDRVVLVDEQTSKVIRVIGAVVDLLN